MEKITITWYGQSAFKIDVDSEILLIDPWFNKSPVSPVKAGNFKKVDLIAVTHGHNDHFGDSAEIIRKTGASLICSPEIGYYMQGKGFQKDERIAPGGTVKKGKIRVSAVNAAHPSALFGEEWPEDPKTYPGGSAYGYVVRSDEDFSIYHAGDTAIMMDMQLICEMYHPDVALLPIGGRFTMDIDTAVMSCKFLKPKVVIPMHYNATALTQADPREFVEKMKKAWPEIKVVILQPGETYLAKEN